MMRVKRLVMLVSDAYETKKNRVWKNFHTSATDCRGVITLASSTGTDLGEMGDSMGGGDAGMASLMGSGAGSGNASEKECLN